MSVNLFPEALKDIRLNILLWYDEHQRVLAWRAHKGQTPNPYYVYLSEIMLQQTTVAKVKDYFKRFIKKWPTLKALANASIDEILVEWQGLGYYSRARNLHAAVQILAKLFSFPRDPKALKELPGVGDYTAAAIASIAFDYRVVPIDGNILRVFARLFALEVSGLLLKQEVYGYAARMADGARPGDFAQGLMDLGAMVCRPLNPKCMECPLKVICRAYAQRKTAEIPLLKVKPEKPTRYGVAYVLLQGGKILLEKRPSKGLLGGMMGVPTTSWQSEPFRPEDSLKPEKGLKWRKISQPIKHTFTHFHLYLTVKVGVCQEVSKEFNQGFWEGKWIPLDKLQTVALPTVMKKVIKQIPKKFLDFTIY